MNDAVLVRGFERVGDLASNGEGLWNWKALRRHGYRLRTPQRYKGFSVTSVLMFR